MFKIIIVSTLLSLIGAANIRKEFPDGRIVGGYPTTIELFPHQVSMQYRDRHSCGGSIISDTYILTAAHCTLSINENLVTVRAGTSLKTEDGVVVQVSELIVHEKFSFSTADYDIALIKLKTPLKFSDKIRPVKLAPENEIVPSGTNLTVTGWGALNEGGASPNQLQAVELAALSNEECNVLMSDVITERMLCAGYIQGGKDACQGDSGGPLVNDDVLVGVVSWGYGCARPKNPGVYTNVAKLRSWIKEHSGL